MPTTLLKPELYAVHDDQLVLLGGECACGNVFFPMQTFGCERCGRHGEALHAKALRARGELLTATVVHMHADAKRQVPFAVGVVALEEGPTIRALLDVPGAADKLRVRVGGILAPVLREDGSQAFDLRFKVEA